jgi:hypothetical protein
MAHNLVDQKFFMLTVQSEAPRRGTNRYWVCLCDCGGSTVAFQGDLLRGHTLSCGCERRRRLDKAIVSHGKSHTRLYSIWCNMHTRCFNPKSPSFRNYGGRGICVDARWTGESGFCNFAHDMGDPPSPKHSLDRIDNNGHYSPDNCRWATRRQQADNTRVALRIAFQGETHSINEWADILHIDRKLIANRLKQGWSIDDALTRPKR